MKQLTCILLFLSLAFLANTQTLYGGLSLGYFHYHTIWYYHNGSGSPYYDNNAAHNINRSVIAASLDKEELMKRRNFQLDLGGELLLGVSGNTKATYLGGDNTISSGGWSAGIYPYLRLVYLPESSGGTTELRPFLSLGPQYMFLHNNGKGSSSAIEEYYYDGGWNEGVLQMTAALGVECRWDHFLLTPALRFGLFGWSSSSWEPHGRDVTMNGSPSLIAFTIRISKPLK